MASQGRRAGHLALHFRWHLCGVIAGFELKIWVAGPVGWFRFVGGAIPGVCHRVDRMGNEKAPLYSERGGCSRLGGALGTCGAALKIVSPSPTMWRRLAQLHLRAGRRGVASVAAAVGVFRSHAYGVGSLTAHAVLVFIAGADVAGDLQAGDEVVPPASARGVVHCVDVRHVVDGSASRGLAPSRTEYRTSSSSRPSLIRKPWPR